MAGRADIDAVAKGLGAGPSARLGYGSEAVVYDLDDGTVARIPRVRGPTAGPRISLLGRLRSDRVPFHVPEILDVLFIDGFEVTLERRLPGIDGRDALARSSTSSGDRIVESMMETLGLLGDLVDSREPSSGAGPAPYGELIGDDAIGAPSWRDWAAARLDRNVSKAGLRAGVDVDGIVGALPEPPGPAFTHLDAFAGNMLVHNSRVTAVIDFGPTCVMGDRRLDIVLGAVYLQPPIVDGATDRHRRVARAHLQARGLDDLYDPVERFIAAYWSFAIDDVTLHQWCRAVLS